MVLWSLLKRVPGSEGTKVLVGTAFLLGVGAVPFYAKKYKAGHDLFSSEKPEAIEKMQEEQKRKVLTKVS